MGREIGQGINDLDVLDDQAGPAVRVNEGQRIFMLRPQVNKADVQAIDLGHELRETTHVWATGRPGLPEAGKGRR
jgi:hypothetical protein